MKRFFSTVVSIVPKTVDVRGSKQSPAVHPHSILFFVGRSAAGLAQKQRHHGECAPGRNDDVVSAPGWPFGLARFDPLAPPWSRFTMLRFIVCQLIGFTSSLEKGVAGGGRQGDSVKVVYGLPLCGQWLSICTTSFSNNAGCNKRESEPVK